MATAKAKEDKVRELGYHTAGVATNVLFSKVASLAVTGIAFVLVSRLLGPTTYGVYVLAISFAGVFIAFGDLGVSIALPKFIAEYRAHRQKKKVEEVVASGFVTIILVGIALTIIAIAFGVPISQFVFKSSSYYYITVVASICITLSMLWATAYSALIGFGRKGSLVTLTLLQVTTQSVVSIALILLGFGAFGPVIGFGSGLALGAVGAIASIYKHEKLKFRMPGSASIKALLVFTLPVWVYSASTGIVLNSSNLILGFFSSKAVVGNVGVSLRFGSIMALAIDSVGVALLPLFSSLTKAQRKHTNRLYNYSVSLMLAFLLPVIAAICVLSWNITVILWPSFTALPYLVPIVSVGVIFIMLYTYTATVLISKGKVRPLMKYSIAISVLEIVLLFLVVPEFKGVGLTAVVALVIPFVSFLVYMRLAGKLIGLKLDYGKISRITAASVITAIVIAPLPFIFSRSSITTLCLSAAVILVLYPLLVSRLNGLTRKDLSIITGLSNTMPIVGFPLAALAEYALRCKNGMED